MKIAKIKPAFTTMNTRIRDHLRCLSTPEQKCVGWPEQKYIGDAGRNIRPLTEGLLLRRFHPVR
jgi:hypothetical protein